MQKTNQVALSTLSKIKKKVKHKNGKQNKKITLFISPSYKKKVVKILVGVVMLSQASAYAYGR